MLQVNKTVTKQKAIDSCFICVNDCKQALVPWKGNILSSKANTFKTMFR